MKAGNTGKVGIIGAGQLGRMLALAGYPLGLTFKFLDPDPNAPARHLGEFCNAAYDDTDAVLGFFRDCDVVTTEFENVSAEVTRRFSKTPGFPKFWPGAEILARSQDRLTEKTMFQELGIATAKFCAIDDARIPDDFTKAVGFPAVIKTRRFGYDGKGQAVVQNVQELQGAVSLLGAQPLIAEGFVKFARELSLISVRGIDGQMAFYPLVENKHRDGILSRTTAPARDVTATLQRDAETMAARIMTQHNYVGVMTLELFDTADGLVANEMAPRVHNSGHWTIEGAVCSQFENHMRAVAGLPLGATEIRAPSVMLNILHKIPDLSRLLTAPGVNVHMYGKAARPGRKLGHVTICHSDDTVREERVRQVMTILQMT